MQEPVGQPGLGGVETSKRPLLRITGRVILGLVILAAVASITYVLARPWILNWGATKEEASQPLPGDELVPEPESQMTLVVPIDAPAEEVWPWLVQMGVDRAGLYTYLLVENGLFRLGVTNADRIHPEWQDIKVGDRFWFTPEDYPGPRMGPVVTDIEPNRALILCLGESVEDCPGTWQFVLDKQDDGSTRLLLRSRSAATSPLGLIDRILEPGYFVMNRGMLLGIEQKAEGEPLERSLAERVSFACMIIAALGLVAMLFSRRWPQTLIVASMGACLATLVFFVGYPSPVYAALLDLGILVALLWAHWPQRSLEAGREGEV